MKSDTPVYVSPNAMQFGNGFLFIAFACFESHAHQDAL
jgi:hypothetical protein